MIAERSSLLLQLSDEGGNPKFVGTEHKSYGNDKYVLIDIDLDDKHITAADAVEGVKPFKA